MEQFEQYYRLPQDVVGHDAALLSYWDTMPARARLRLLESDISVSTLGELKMLAERFGEELAQFVKTWYDGKNKKERGAMLFLWYPKCTTCQRAKKFLDERGVEYTPRHIKEDNPCADELREWFKRSGLPLKKFFNTSGIQYRALELKDKLPAMSEEEQLELLASDGMLVKRPVLVGDGFVLTGFRQSEWEEKL